MDPRPDPAERATVRRWCGCPRARCARRPAARRTRCSRVSRRWFGAAGVDLARPRVHSAGRGAVRIPSPANSAPRNRSSNAALCATTMVWSSQELADDSRCREGGLGSRSRLVEQFRPAEAHPSLHDRVHPRCRDAGLHGGDAFVFETAPKAEVLDGLCHPAGGRMRGGTKDPHTAVGVLDDGENVLRCPVSVTVSMRSQASSVSAWERRESAQVVMRRWCHESVPPHARDGRAFLASTTARRLPAGTPSIRRPGRLPAACRRGPEAG
jgi:hypothetical protein